MRKKTKRTEQQEKRNKEMTRIWRIKNAEKIRQDQRDYHLAHREHCLAQSKAWKLRNKERIAAYNKALQATPEFKERNRLQAKSWTSRNRERHSEWRKRNYEQKREHKRQVARLYRLNNPDKVRAWANRNPEKKKAALLKWRLAHPEVYVANAQRRKALKLSTIENPELVDGFIKKVKKKRRVRCYYCDKTFHGKESHIDHIIPLSKQGKHSIENLCISCPQCNLSKHNKPLQEWKKRGQQVLAL